MPVIPFKVQWSKGLWAVARVPRKTRSPPLRTTRKPHSPSSFWVVLNTSSVVLFRGKIKAKAPGFYPQFNLFNLHCIHTKSTLQRVYTVWFGGTSVPPVSGWFLYPMLGLPCARWFSVLSPWCGFWFDPYAGGLYHGKGLCPLSCLMVWLWVEQYLLARWILYRSTQ